MRPKLQCKFKAWLQVPCTTGMERFCFARAFWTLASRRAAPRRSNFTNCKMRRRRPRIPLRLGKFRLPNARVAEAGQLHYWEQKQLTTGVRIHV
jgi:hypothetical protein